MKLEITSMLILLLFGYLVTCFSDPLRSGISSTPLPESLKRSLSPELLLNLHNLIKLGNEDTMLEVIQILTRALEDCASEEKTPSMRRTYFSNRTIVCNDGSRAGYYIRKSVESRRWVIYLEGGWYCFDRKSCEIRWVRTRNLMTSSTWPETRIVGGILSSDPEENPHWWNSNHVFVPYCSSDSWSGLSPAKEKGDFAFLGSLIVLEVIKDLVNLGLYEAEHLLLTGSSAGGTGVLVNIDSVADLLSRMGSKVKVRGVSDSGWFLDNVPYESVECLDPHTCSPAEAIKRGIKLWNGQVPKKCKDQYSSSDYWRCYFGYKVYPTLQAPVFVFQWLFDEAQMTADNVGAPVSKAQWDYIHTMGNDLRASLQNVTAVFAPSCISHIVLTKRDWRHVKINQNTLPEAIWCWEHQGENPGEILSKFQTETNLSDSGASPAAMLADAPYGQLTTPLPEATSRAVETSRNERRKRRKERRRHRIGRNKKRKNNGKKVRLTGSKQRQKRTPRYNDNMRARWQYRSNTFCHHWLMDECTWPQCNRDCPRLHNPFTGEEMDFIELLKSFGLDMGSVANALGIDLTTLNEMDHDTLLQLLTQQTN